MSESGCDPLGGHPAASEDESSGDDDGATRPQSIHEDSIRASSDVDIGSSSSSETGATTNSEERVQSISLQTLQDRLTEALDDLLRLAFTIRRQSSQKHQRRAETYEPTSDDFDGDNDDLDPGYPRSEPDDASDLVGDFRRYIRPVIQREMGNGRIAQRSRSDAEYLIQRLQDALERKWRRTCYHHAHLKRLAQASTHEPGQSGHTLDGAGADLNPKYGDQAAELESSAGYTLTTNIQSAATTAPSYLEVPTYGERQTVSVRSTARGEDLGDSVPPRPPSHAMKNGYTYLCPYCGKNQQTSRRLTMKAWR